MIIRSLGTFIIILLLGFVQLGCSGDRSKQITFDAEKSFHQIEKLYESATIKPDLADTVTWGKVKDAYLELIGYCWTHLDSIPAENFPDEREGLESIAFMTTTRLASVYYAEGKFDSSIVILQQLLSLTNLTDRPLLSARSNLAQAYHANGDWQSGMEIYYSLIDSFYPPIDRENKIIHEVLNLPIELLNIERKLKNIPQGDEGSQSALEYYKKLISDWPDTELEKAARRTLARLYSDLKEWDEAIETLSYIKDSTGQIGIPESMKIGELISVGRKDYLAAISVYKKLLDRVTDSSLMVSIYTRIGAAYYDNESYSDCRATMEIIRDKFSSFYMANPVPQKYLALSFDKEGNWDRAEDEYQWLITNFPNTEEAFDSYLTIAGHYDDIQNKTLADTWFRKADEFYSRMQLRHTGTFIEASAISYRAEVARRQGHWQDAAYRLEELFTRFPDKEIGYKSLVNAISIYREKLDNKPRADSLQSLIPAGT